MTEYSILMLLSFIIPFLFSFEKQIFFIKRIKEVLLSIFIVGIPYLIWDALFTKHKIWGFSEGRVSDLKFFLLPLEEVLFFVVVPYALIFIYEVLSFYFRDRVIHLNLNYNLIIALAFLFLSIIAYPRIYTTTQMLVTALFFLLIPLFKINLISTKNYWLFILISFIPFLVVNYFLTSIPIVWYDNSENLSIRILTIPLEDFFYHFTYSSFVIIVYSYLVKR